MSSPCATLTVNDAVNEVGSSVSSTTCEGCTWWTTAVGAVTTVSKSPYFDNVRELPLLGALWQYNVYVGLGVPKTISSDDPFSRLDAIRNVIM